MAEGRNNEMDLNSVVKYFVVGLRSAAQIIERKDNEQSTVENKKKLEFIYAQMKRNNEATQSGAKKSQPIEKECSLKLLLEQVKEMLSVTDETEYTATDIKMLVEDFNRCVQLRECLKKHFDTQLKRSESMKTYFEERVEGNKEARNLMEIKKWLTGIIEREHKTNEKLENFIRTKSKMPEDMSLRDIFHDIPPNLLKALDKNKHPTVITTTNKENIKKCLKTFSELQDILLARYSVLNRHMSCVYNSWLCKQKCAPVNQTTSKCFDKLVGLLRDSSKEVMNFQRQLQNCQMVLEEEERKEDVDKNDEEKEVEKSHLISNDSNLPSSLPTDMLAGFAKISMTLLFDKSPRCFRELVIEINKMK